MTRAHLTYAALDGLAFAANRGRLDKRRDLPALSAESLGPLLEWRVLSHNGFLPKPEEVSWLSLDAVAPIISAIHTGRRQWICPTSSAGVFRTPAKWPDNDVGWIGFGLAAQKGATMAGFHRQTAAQLVGGMVELVSNIYEHSGAPDSGMVAFLAGDGAFEFVVADSGIGVLESLRSCPEYSDLADHGTALRLALRDGVSRFGSAARRGCGFRPIFVGLANLRGSLRFRSGDHALVIDGQRIDVMSAKTAQKTCFRGFLVSVTCQIA